MSDETENRQLVVAIVDFLRGELSSRNDLTLEDRDSLGIAIECLELAYGLENLRDRRVRRPLTDVFNQVTHPPTVKDRVQAERLKEEGNEKMNENQYEEALEAYSQAIALDKWNPIYYCNRAAAHLQLQQFYDAISDCKQALSLNPDYAKAFSRMGQAYAMMERHRYAARCYQHAVELDPDNERYRHNLSVAESQAANSQSGADLVQSVLNLLFSSGNQSPPGILTIITDITPSSEESSSAETPNAQSESPAQSESNDETVQEERSNEPPMPGILRFALPIMLGSLLGHHLAGHSHNEEESTEIRSDEDSWTTVSSNSGVPSLEEINANQSETPNFEFGHGATTGESNSNENYDVMYERENFQFGQPSPNGSEKLENEKEESRIDSASDASIEIDHSNQESGTEDLQSDHTSTKETDETTDLEASQSPAETVTHADGMSNPAHSIDNSSDMASSK